MGIRPDVRNGQRQARKDGRLKGEFKSRKGDSCTFIAEKTVFEQMIRREVVGKPDVSG
jgi:hypothetical protein